MNPYSAPQSRLGDPAPRPGSPYKAVGLGLLTDFGGTLALTVALSFLYGVVLAAQGVPQDEIARAITDASVDSWYFWAASIGGGACSVAGGYVCARVAGQSEYTLGVILAVIVVAIGAVIGGWQSELGTTIVLNAATVASVILGAWLGKKRNRRQRAGPSTPRQ